MASMKAVSRGLVLHGIGVGAARMGQKLGLRLLRTMKQTDGVLARATIAAALDDQPVS
jgi:hypothetical protein